MSPSLSQPLGFDAPYARLDIDPSLEIRTVTGIRPYRPQGHVLRKENVKGREVIHNYGHGGAGVTLCWGCAEHAAELVTSPSGTEVSVLGGGVIGLTTALILLKKGYLVTVYADKFSPDTLSDVAAAYWYPVTLYDEMEVSKDYLDQFRDAAQRSFRHFFELMDQPRYGIDWFRFYELADESDFSDVAEPIEGAELYPGHEIVEGPAQTFGYAHARRHLALIIDMSIFLPALVEDVRELGGKLVRRSFTSVNELKDLPAGPIVNSTGMGAKQLFGDNTLIPVKGQVTLLEKRGEIDYGYAVGRGQADYYYMYPRRNGLVLGGTKHVGIDNQAISSIDRDRILQGHQKIAERINTALKNGS